MKPKVTPWFPAGTRPARVGVYEVKAELVGSRFQFWDGLWWRARSTTQRSAYLDRVYSTIFHHPTWRGLAKKPK